MAEGNGRYGSLGIGSRDGRNDECGSLVGDEAAAGVALKEDDGEGCVVVEAK